MTRKKRAESGKVNFHPFGISLSIKPVTTSPGTPLVRIRDLTNHFTETNFVGISIRPFLSTKVPS